jgi:hypothetical protein
MHKKSEKESREEIMNTPAHGNHQQPKGKVPDMQDANDTFRPVKLASNREQSRKKKTLGEGDGGSNTNPIHEKTKTRMLCHRCKSANHFIAKCPKEVDKAPALGSSQPHTKKEISDANMNPTIDMYDGTKTRMLCHKCKSVSHLTAKCPETKAFGTWLEDEGDGKSLDTNRMEKISATTIQLDNREKEMQVIPVTIISDEQHGPKIRERREEVDKAPVLTSSQSHSSVNVLLETAAKQIKSQHGVHGPDDLNTNMNPGLNGTEGCLETQGAPAVSGREETVAREASRREHVRGRECGEPTHSEGMTHIVYRVAKGMIVKQK